MSRSSVVRRLVAVAVGVAAGLGLAACSSGSYQSDYVSPIAVTAAPPPVVPVANAPAGAAQRRLPLLPPVPEDQSMNGLPPVSVASLLPPPMR
ncbi:hypothetical protein EYW49_19850 [Siculibacillus lacustris]|uniref:Uncharacterized protein n=1 Tax=Siculibacillus lacustris TaxID=1549641 RepID=A0A4Q9VFU5_9HYPH|nr:hypothetical protein [Siculibacillus lacustris]TBW33638.1 hypothetical protein EYW49_19850 [Siculibacillus lacustris]